MHAAVGIGIDVTVDAVIEVGDSDNIGRCCLRVTGIRTGRADSYGIGSTTLRLVVNVGMSPAKVGVVVITACCTVALEAVAC